jgi:stearoyl-CoA desaturase (delta-9 desaturase)
MRYAHILVAKNRAGIRMLSKVTVVAMMMMVGLKILHPVLQPLCVVILGGAGLAMNMIGLDCEEGLFFRTKALNKIVGGLIHTFCHPFGTSRRSEASTPLWKKFPLFLFTIIAAISFQQRTSMLFLKYWILPIVMMQIMMRSIEMPHNLSVLGGASRRLLFFPELIQLKTKEAVLQKTSTATEKVPLYRLPLAIKELWLAQEWKHKEDDEQPRTTPAHFACLSYLNRLPLVVTRELLFWRKRDTLLWIVMGACAVVGLITRYYEFLEGILPAFPLLVIVPFLLWKSHAAKAVDYLHLAVAASTSSSTPVFPCSPSSLKLVEIEAYRYEATDAFAAAQEYEAYRASLRAAMMRKEEAKKTAVAIALDPFYPELTDVGASGCCGAWTWDQIRIPMTVYIVGVHVLALVALNWLRLAKVQTLAWAFFLWPVTGFGITGGAHRLWAHRSYDAVPIVRWVIMICASIANQGTVFHWARDHRVHHQNSETDADPHNAKRGFFFAHVGWLLLKKDERVKIAGRKLDISDLKADRALSLQRKLDPYWNLFWCFLFPMIVAHYGWGETWACGYFVPGVLRYVWVLHVTWLVNSAAHLWGEHPYDPNSNPAENPIVSVLAMGEGWHNWHHAFPFDYAASELGVSSQYNPTKLTIDALAKFGLVSNRKRALKHWARREQRLQPDFKDLLQSETAHAGYIGCPPFRRRRWISK